MSDVAKQAASIIDMLPHSDQLFALEFIKKLVLAWDPDFSKLTPQEAVELKEALSGEYVPLDLENAE